jgi:ABC-type branched-subunit amino acid transport system substrate-binding protein
VRTRFSRHTWRHVRLAVNSSGMALVLAFAIIGLLLLSPQRLAAQLNPQEAAGKRIYTQGVGHSPSPIQAVLGGGGSRIPGSLMPCSSCHGPDGQGRPEGGVMPSNITWDVLTRPLTSSERLARQRPTYDLTSLRRAITEGVDPADHKLGLTMPRFVMSQNDLDSLIAYLHLLGKEADPGLENNSIRIGTVIPQDGAMATLGSSFAALLKAYFDDMNRQGGIYGRKIEFSILRAKGTPSQVATLAADFVSEKQIFALVGVLPPTAEQKVDIALQQAGVPVITPFASGNDDDESSDKSEVFHLLSGLSQQTRVVVRFAREQFDAKTASVAVVSPRGDQTLAASVVQECHAQAFASVVPVKYSNLPAEAGGIINSLHKASVDGILFLGDGTELRELLLAAKKLNWTPAIFQPGALAGGNVFNVPQEFNGKVYFSFPSLPSDIAADSRNEYEALVRDHGLKITEPLLSTSALATAKVLAEALRQTGRQLSRQKLINTLSAMYNFETGLTPPVTFGVTRRIGALGSYVMKLDLKNNTLLQAADWMAP